MMPGCASVDRLSAESRQMYADALTGEAGWIPLRLEAGRFNLRAFAPPAIPPGQVLTVFIEGDGLSWIRRGRPASNPTPLDPVALKLALVHPQPRAVYLARPCQYVPLESQTHCKPFYWTSGRYHEDVVAALDAALDLIKERYQTSEFELVGYSGGGSLAVLLAARRDDVVRIVTVAANLDHRAWTQMHGVSELRHSLNAVDVVRDVSAIRQLHIAGREDSTVPLAVLSAYRNAMDSSVHSRYVVVPDFSHDSCWSCIWPTVLSSTPSSRDD